MTVGRSSNATDGGGSVIYSGTITGLTITTEGTGYSAGTLSATGGGGSGFAGTYTVNGTGGIDSVTITNIGSGYTSTPTIVISGSSGPPLSGTFTASEENTSGAMMLTSAGHGMSIGDIFQVTTTGTFPAGDDVDPGRGLAVDTNFWADNDASAFSVNTWLVATTSYTEGGPYMMFEDAGTGTHSFSSGTTINGLITADVTGGLLTDPAGDSTTIKRTRRYGNENASTSSLVLEASSWIFDLWGENLIGMSTADGRIFQWDPTTTSPTNVKAVVIANAPIDNSAILVSKQRHLFAFGAGGNNRKIQWSHAESETTWGATATNQAGSFEIDSSGEILAGRTVGDRILVWTSTDLHAVDWVGMPYVYGRKKIGDACGAISNRAMIAVGDRAFWMSQGGFFQYQGSVQPLKCDVQDHIFKDINRVQDSKIYASMNPEFFEVTWWYASSTSDEILKYATYNYAEGWWSTGELARTAFASGSPGVYDNPIGIADDGTVYEHEINVSSSKRTTNQIATTNSDVSDFDRKLVTGTDATNDVGLCFAEAVMEIGDGENVANITQLVTDTSGVGDNGLRFKFKTSYTPNGTESTSSNYDLAADGYTDVREQGRQFTYRIESGFDQYWEIGSIRAEMSAGGRR